MTNSTNRFQVSSTYQPNIRRELYTVVDTAQAGKTVWDGTYPLNLAVSQATRMNKIYDVCREMLALLPTELLNSEGITTMVNGPVQEIALTEERNSRI